MRDKIKIFLQITGGNSGLTEDFIYMNQPKSEDDKIDVYSSATQENNALRKISKNAKINGKKIKIFEGEGIIIARNGKAGSMTYIETGKCTMNDHAYFIKVRNEYKNEINIKFFMESFKKEIEACITSDKKGNRTFNKTLFEETIVDIPDINMQNRNIKEYEKAYILKNKIEREIKRITYLLNTIPNAHIGDVHPIEEVFDMISEDRRMTEEYIYNHQGIFPVYSAQIEGAYGYIDSYNFEGEILSVVCYGDSGKTTLRSGKLTIGRNACGLIPKEKYRDKVLLRFAKYALQDVFVNNAKGSDLKSLSQSTINSTEFFLPDLKEQEIIALEYEKMENLIIKLKKVDNSLKKILSCQIS